MTIGDAPHRVRDSDRDAPVPQPCPTRADRKLASVPSRPPHFREVATIDREHPRYAHEAAVTFHVGATQHEGRTQNVSRGGLCANLADALPVGTDVDVSLVLVFDDDMQSEALRLPARIVWCTSLDESHQVGLAFRPLDAERAEYLTIFLRYLDDHRTEKRPRDLSVDDRFR